MLGANVQVIKLNKMGSSLPLTLAQGMEIKEILDR
jgi:hypothetical protein